MHPPAATSASGAAALVVPSAEGARESSEPGEAAGGRGAAPQAAALLAPGLRSPSPVPPAQPLPALPLLRLLQLSSSLCPIGAFAYSQGLEAAVERRWVTDEASLSSWLLGLGEAALARLDLPWLARAHAAAAAEDGARLAAIAERVLASREARELAEQEQKLGRALASVLETLGVERAAPLARQEHTSYVVTFALGAAAFGASQELALLGYSYAWCEQQVSAAARLVPLGHMAAQRALSRALEQIPEWVRAALERPDEEIGSSTPGLAMSAAWHEVQYSRLFRS